MSWKTTNWSLPACEGGSVRLLLGSILRFLPLRLLLGGLGPLAGARGSPVACLGAIPGSGCSAGEARSAGLPLTSRRGSDGLGSRGGNLLLSGLLLLGLLLRLGVRVAVCGLDMLAKYRRLLFLFFTAEESRRDLQKYKSGMTSQEVSRLWMVPRRRRTSRASNHQIVPMA